MLKFCLLYFFCFISPHFGALGQDMVPGSMPVQEVTAQDSVQLLTNEWVLREQLMQEGGNLTPVTPLDSLTLELFEDQTYKLVRSKQKSVEWGNWQMNRDRSLIAVQVTNVDGCSILSAKLGRWEIMKLTKQQFVLKPYGFGDQYLVFERRI